MNAFSLWIQLSSDVVEATICNMILLEGTTAFDVVFFWVPEPRARTIAPWQCVHCQYHTLSGLLSYHRGVPRRNDGYCFLKPKTPFHSVSSAFQTLSVYSSGRHLCCAPWTTSAPASVRPTRRVYIRGFSPSGPLRSSVFLQISRFVILPAAMFSRKVQR